jgi:hypothetical protein
MTTEILILGIMVYQTLMPAVENGKYQIIYDGDSIVRMNTQNGTMERCDKNLNCIKIKEKNETK